MTVRSGAATSVVFGDAVFNMPHLTGIHGFVLKHITGLEAAAPSSRAWPGCS